MRAVACVLLASAVVAACSVDAEVEVESRRDSDPPASAAPDSDSREEPTTTAPDTTAPPESPGEVAVPVRFVLDEVIVEVTLRDTDADTPPGGTDGFRTAVELDDGVLVASGFDARGDGFETEPSALWRSTDGTFWQRVGLGVSSEPDRQDIRSLVLDSGSPVAFGTFLDTAGPSTRVAALGTWTAGPAGDDWTSQRGASDTTVRAAVSHDGDVIAVGADDANTPGGFRGITITDATDLAARPVHVDVGADGSTTTGSVVMDIGIDAADGSWLAVGLTTITDSGRTGAESLADAETIGFASDIAIWRSSDSGQTWELVDHPAFADVAGSQAAAEVVRVDGRWWVLTKEQGEGASFVHRIHTSADGVEWTRHPYERTPTIGGNELATTRGLHVVDGIVVIVDELSDLLTPSMVVTMIDASTGATDSHDLTAELAVHGMEDVIVLSDGVTGLGFGQVDRGPSASDLQVVEITRSDDEPETEEPAPTTTSPASGGSSTDA